MAIKPRGNSWQVAITLGDKRYRRSFKTEAEAQSWELEIKLKHARGEEILTKNEEKVVKAKSSITWQQLADTVYDQRWQHQKSSHTHRTNSLHIAEILGLDTLVSELTQADIDRVGKVIKEGRGKNKGNSLSTVNRKYSALSVMIKFAQKRGYIDKMFEITKYKEPEHRIRWISDQEEKQILDYFDKVKPVVSDIVKVLIDTGLRCGELWRLTVNDVSDTHLTVWISKGGKPRTIPLTKRARSVLKKYTEGRDGKEQVFSQWNNWKLTHYWGRVRAHLSLTKDAQFVPHILRHTFCSRLVQKGVPLSHVQRLAGHSDISTTLRYAHLSQSDLDEAILALEQ